MKYIGAHVDTTLGVAEAPLQAYALGARAFAFNLADPSRWQVPAATEAEAALFRARCNELGYEPEHSILPHSAFVVNLGSPDARKLALSRKTFCDELRKCRSLGVTLLNFHPGAHLRQSDEETCLQRIAESINVCLDKTEGVTAVLENTAGQGSNLGYTFAQLGYIIDRIEDKSRIGVCIDSAHAIAAGYDMSTPEGYREAWEEFDTVIGRQYLRAMHINDSQREVGSRIDRHAPVGEGTLGAGFFRMLMADPRTDGIPLILETPNPAIWAREIEWLYSIANDES